MAKRLIILSILVFYFLISKAQPISFSVDTTFKYGLEGAPTFGQIGEVRDIYEEPTGNYLFTGTRNHNSNPGGQLTFYANRCNQFGSYLYNSYNIENILIVYNSLATIYKTSSGYLFYVNSSPVRYSFNGLNGELDSLNIQLNQKLSNNIIGTQTGAQAYYNENDGSFIYVSSGENSRPFLDTSKIIIKILGNGQIDSTFNHNYSGGLGQMAGVTRVGDHLYFCGKFEYYDGVYMPQIARTDTLGNLDTSFRYDAKIVKDIGLPPVAIQEDGKLLCMAHFYLYLPNGDLTVIDTLRFFRLNVDGTMDTTFNYRDFTVANLNGGVSSVLILQDSSILVGGRFFKFGNYNLRGLAKLDKNGYLDTNYLNLPHMINSTSLLVPPNSFEVRKLKLMPNGQIMALGLFGGADNHNSINALRLNGYFPVNTQKLLPNLKTLQLYPNPAQNQVRINLGQEISKPQLLYLRDISGKLVKTYSITEPNQALDIGGVAKGLYFVCLQGYRVEKLVIN